MRFLLVSYNFAPEKTGIGKYNGEWVEWLVSRGHQVDVITSNPYYPEWKVDEAFRNKKWSTEKRENLTIYRVPMYIPVRVTGFSRIVSDLSFIVTSMVAWCKLIFKREKHDVVIAVCPSMLNGVIPSLYCKFTGAFMLYHIQDLQLDAAVKLGFIKAKVFINLLTQLERFQLESANMVSSISEGMKERILAKGVDEKSYFMLGNWVDVDFIKPDPTLHRSALGNKLGFRMDDKVILYSGNLGEKQGIDIILDTAELLQAHTNWKFLICGEGVHKCHLIESARIRGLNQVVFSPLQPYSLLPELLNMADVHLVPQKKAAADLVLPSKLTGILAAGGVAIVASEPETTLYKIVNDNSIGYTIEPENAMEMAKAIRMALCEDTSLIRRCARQFAEKTMNKEVILQDFENLLFEKGGFHTINVTNRSI